MCGMLRLILWEHSIYVWLFRFMFILRIDVNHWIQHERRFVKLCVDFSRSRKYVYGNHQSSNRVQETC